MKARWWLALISFAPGAAVAQEPLVSGVRTPAALRGSANTLTGSTKDFASLTTQIVTVAPGAGLHPKTPHADSEELIIVKDGALRATVNGHRRTLGPGSVVVVMPGDEHGLENAGRAPLTCYVFTYRSKLGPDSVRARRAGGSFMVDWTDVVLQKTPTGGVRRIFDRATTMFNRIEMHVSTLNEGLTNHPAHTHGAEEMVVLLRGNVRMLVGQERQNATRGDVIFLASMIPHSLDNTGTVSAEYFAFQWQ